MPPTPACSLLKETYRSLLSLQEAFQAELKAAAKTGDFRTLESLRQEIIRHQAIIEGNLVPFEQELKLKEQYEKQQALFEKIGLLEKRKGVSGIQAIDGNFHPFPTLREVSKRLRERKELLAAKIEQGFGKLLVVPFGMKLETLTETMRRALLIHHENGALFSRNQDGTRVPLQLDTANPLYQWDQYQEADTVGSLVYFPDAFDPDPKKHNGKTKRQLLETGGAFQVMLVETDPVIPRETTGATIKGRKRIEANRMPKEYLESLQRDPQYRHEQGLTPEAWMTLFLLQLEATDEVIDDYQGNASLNYNLGGYFPASGYVSNAYWHRDNAQAVLDRFDPSVQDSDGGVRSAVMA